MSAPEGYRVDRYGRLRIDERAMPRNYDPDSDKHRLFGHRYYCERVNK